MELSQLEIEGVWLAESPVWRDDRGFFREWFNSETFEIATGRKFSVSQANTSLSSKGTLRGIHYSIAPEGQAKWITCISGSIKDVIVDIRLNSPTFGKWVAIDLKADSGKAIFIAEGLGHGFLAMEENTCVSYLVSTHFSPEYELEINPLDLQIGISWGMELSKLKISVKDQKAPTLAERLAQEKLPSFIL
jgi:dTDP-4-dehydrorhamnose 3,5-epimerase